MMNTKKEVQTQAEHMGRITTPDGQASIFSPDNGNTARVVQNTRLSEIISPAMDDDVESKED